MSGVRYRLGTWLLRRAANVMDYSNRRLERREARRWRRLHRVGEYMWGAAAALREV